MSLWEMCCRRSQAPPTATVLFRRFVGEHWVLFTNLVPSYYELTISRCGPPTFWVSIHLVKFDVLAPMARHGFNYEDGTPVPMMFATGFKPSTRLMACLHSIPKPSSSIPIPASRPS
jgi:hypothetical protein